MITDLSVCITNFKRAKYLDRAIKSAVANGIQNIVVATDEPDFEVEEVLAKYPFLIISRLHCDGGCNGLWLRAAYHSPTSRLIILHDDDVLTKDFAEAYLKIIKPELDSGRAEFCSWRAHLLYDDGSVGQTEWLTGHRTGLLNSGILRDFLLRMGRLSLSPIISIFDRKTLIGALKEAQQYLTPQEVCLLHPGMLLGTEIIAYLRHCAAFGKWMFVDKVLSLYGCCDSSGTVKAQNNKDTARLIAGYDAARNHFRSGAYSKVVHEPRIVFVYDDVKPKDEDEQRRFDHAMWTWQYHFSTGDVLEFPTHVGQWNRSSADIGDERPAPFFKDLMDHGTKYARPEDVVVYANRDICLTTSMPERVREAGQSLGVAVAWRRNLIPKPGRLYKHVTMARRDGGVDMVCITPEWWNKNRELMPDMLIGRETWDWCFRTLAEEKHGKSIYFDNAIYHEPHPSYWRQNRKTNPGQIHNRNLARVFFARRKDRRALISLQ